MNEQLLQSFNDYLKFERLTSAHTRTAYLNDLNQLAVFIYSHFQVDSFLSADLKPRHLRAWVFSLEKLEQSSIKRKVSAVRSFFRYLRARGFRSDQVGADLAVRLCKRRIPITCSLSSVSRMYERANGQKYSFAQLRDQLLIDLLFGCGLRRIEASTLTVENVDLNRKLIEVLGKGNKQRQVPLPVEVFNRILLYLKIREAECKCHSRILLLTDSGMPVYPQFIYRRIKYLSSGIGDSPATHPHALRHAYASTLIDEGAELSAVSELLGHSSAQTTQIYVHNSLERLKKLYSEAHPRNTTINRCNDS